MILGDQYHLPNCLGLRMQPQITGIYLELTTLEMSIKKASGFSYVISSPSMTCEIVTAPRKHYIKLITPKQF